MDIAKINAAQDLESATCEIFAPDSGDYLFSFVMAGPTHPKTRQLTESEGRGLAHQSKRSGGMQKAIDSRLETLLTDSDAALEKQVKGLLARTLDWLDVTDGGNAKSFDAKQTEVWYREKSWLRDQVMTFLNEPKNFTKSSATTSSPTSSTN